MKRAGFVVALTACSVFEPDALPPHGEALFVVDTDLPVPAVVSRLRIDIYGEDGRWTESRDDLLPDPRDWPVSFSVFSDDETKDRVVLVRLRAYPDGELVRYRGHVFAEPEELIRTLPAGDGTPRLFADGRDATPELEPDPLLTIDRVVRVRLVHGRRGRVRVVLRGACAGRMSRIALPGVVESCVDGDRAPVIDSPLEPTLDRDVPSESGTFARQPCDGATAEDRVCVPGGVFVFGDNFHRPLPRSGVGALDARPARVVVVSRFLVDRDEVTVGRFRRALARGFVPPVPVGVLERDGPPESALDACTFSAAPRGREDYGLSCVAWATARAFCLHEGGDLPTEAQWEYAALAAGRASKAKYPWGDDPPDCTRAVFGRGTLGMECRSLGEGPAPIGPGDDLNALGIRGFGGGLAELVRDRHASFRADCWRLSPAIDPVCTLPLPTECDADPDACPYGVRGGSWADSGFDLDAVDRSDAATHGGAGSVLRGFRCVYPAP